MTQIPAKMQKLRRAKSEARPPKRNARQLVSDVIEEGGLGGLSQLMYMMKKKRMFLEDQEVHKKGGP